MTARMLLSGYYGFGNFGDEALLAVIVEQLRRRFPSSQLEVLSATPNATARNFGVEVTPRWDWRAIGAAIARADVVLSGGGGLLQNATSLRSLLYYATVLREAIRRRRKTMVFAQSVGPLDFWGRLVVQRWCKGVDRATVRDERSRRLLQGLLPRTPVERTADPVFLYDPAGEPDDLAVEGLGPESGPYAIVSVRKSGGLRDASRVLARAIDRLAQRHGVRAAFLPLGGASDAAISTDVIRACSSAPVLLPETSLPRSAAILRGARIVIGMRLHALILAARYGVPFLAMAYDPKVAALCEDLDYPLAPLWTAQAPRRSDVELDELVDRLVAQRDELGARLAARVETLRTAAARNFDVLAELLSDG
ncbi:MAG: polysaccharide pyruvyl transferase CsaB [Candidatus Eremiobacteraeota bacterium]|nr:polysaccharide pyruvyl transferase CsaB [Candidatus Eremiobacteraeota bacterium]